MAGANITAGQAWSSLGIGAGIGATFGYFSGRNIKAALESQARIYEINAEAERYAAERDIRYYNEKAAREGWSKKEEMKNVMSSQNVAMAASGFVSQSAGDKRLLTDTYAKYEDAERAANRALYLQSFERMRKAEMNAIEMRSLAAQTRIQGKYATLSSTLSGLASGMQTGAQVVSVANQFYRDSKLEGSTPSTDSSDFKFYENTGNPSYSMEDITGSNPTNSLLKELNNSSFEFFKNTPEMPYSKSFMNPEDASLKSLLYGRII